MPPPMPTPATAATTAPSLGQSYAAEVRVLDAVMYRNQSQHGRAGYWKRLQHVRRLLRELALPEMLAAVQGAQQELLALRASSSSNNKARAKEKEAAARARLRATGRALHVGAGQCARALGACLRCADALAVEVAQGYFLNLALLLLALLGRVHALVRHAGVTALYVGQALVQEEGGNAPTERLARALGLSVGRKGEAGSGPEQARIRTVVGEDGGGVDNDDDDDVGVALGPALARMAPPPAPTPGATLTTRVIPTTKGKVAAGTVGALGGTGRAMLATDWSSSSEEEEEEEEEGPSVAAAVAAPAQSAMEKEEEQDEDAGVALGFVIDREPEPQPPPQQEQEPPEEPAPAKPNPKKQKQQKHKAAAPLPVPSFLAQQPRPQPPPSLALPSIGKKRKPKPKKAEPAGGGGGGSKGGGRSLLDDIDAIFGSAAPRAKKKKCK